MLAAGVESFMVVRRKDTDDPTVEVTDQVANAIRATLDRELPRLFGRRPESFFTAAALPERTSAAVRALAPDVVHLHWLGGGFLRPEALRRLGRPLVWTLHDAWPFTGGCHVPGACARFAERCGACPALGGRRERDLSRWIWFRKRRALAGVGVVAVAPSRWMAEQARRSSLLAGFPVEVIPNAVDTDVFRPIARETARALLRIASDRRLVLFVAADGTRDPNKGFRFLEEALRRIARVAPGLVELLVVGASHVPDPQKCGVPVHCLGRMHDDVALALAYCAADTVVVPSMQESFSNVTLEGLACGRPVAAFRVGGLTDLIHDGVNGRLVEPFDAGALADAIRWAIEDPARLATLSAAARAGAEREHGLDVQARRHASLYRDVLGQARASEASRAGVTG